MLHCNTAKEEGSSTYSGLISERSLTKMLETNANVNVVKSPLAYRHLIISVLQILPYGDSSLIIQFCGIDLCMVFPYMQRIVFKERKDNRFYHSHIQVEDIC